MSIMKPASYQNMASSVMSPDMTLGNLLSTSNVMRCEKCRFATPDIAAFKKHVAQKHTEYYCFYCNSVSFSEADLQAHLKLHSATGPLKCPHCGQVYMRRLCLVKHIDRLHSKITTQAAPKLDSTKVPHISVSSASQSVPSQEPSTRRPVVRVTVPTPSTTGVRLNKNGQRQKTLDSHQLIANGDGVPLNGHVQHNRALTVPLPEEVSIPAGCMVEVAEVKTVNGTKELRLRFVAHQENESIKKNARTTVSETATVLSSPPNFQNTVKLPGSTIRTVNKTTVNKDSPTLVPVNVSKSSPNLISKEKCRNTKRTSPEVINLDATVPSKVSCGIISSVGEATGAIQKEQINFNMSPAVISSRFSNKLTSNLQPENLSVRICPKGVDDRKTCIQEHPTSLMSRMTNSVQSTPRIMPLNRGSVTVKAMEDPSMQIRKQELACIQQQSLKTQALSLKQSLAAPVQIQTQSDCKDNYNSRAFSPVRGSVHKSSPEPIPAKIITDSSHVDTKLLPLTQEVKTEKPAAEGLPVIYSVYSLSHQPDDAQESTQPIVMAEWTNSAGCDGLKIKSNRIEQSKIASAYHAHMDSQNAPVNSGLSSKSSCQPVKVEQDQDIQHVATSPNGIHIKEETKTPTKERKKCINLKPRTCSPAQNTVSAIETKTLPAENVSLKKPSASNIEMDNCLKYPTVFLKRVQVGVCKKSKRKVVSKIRIPVPDGQRDCRVLRLMPLRKEQVVKRPCINQPVVVLNHPEPQAQINRVTLGSIKNTRACATAKCQILRMKLSKVNGQKYEVMGCTVQSFH